MRKIIFFISFALFISLGIIAYSQEPSPPVTKGQVQPGEVSSQPSTNSNINTKDNNNNSPKTVPPLIKMDTQSSNAETKNTDEENSNGQFGTFNNDSIITYTKWLMIFTGCLVIYNIFLGFYTMRAANAAKRAAESLPTVERAHIFVDSIEWPNKNGPSSLDEFNKSTMVITVVNAGRTPAILQNCNSELIIKGKDYPSKDDLNHTKSLEIPKGIIIKSDRTKIFTVRAGFSPTIISEDAFSQSILLCYGYIRYEDIFGKSHKRGFCYELSPQRSHHGRFHISNSTELNY